MPTVSRKKRTAAAPAPLAAVLPPLQARHRALLRQSTDLGLVLRGTIGKRFMPCGKAACRCKADPPLLHGPYYLWTRKVAGKTVTVHLTAEQGPAASRGPATCARSTVSCRSSKPLGSGPQPPSPGYHEAHGWPHPAAPMFAQALSGGRHRIAESERIGYVSEVLSKGGGC